MRSKSAQTHASFFIKQKKFFLHLYFSFCYSKNKPVLRVKVKVKWIRKTNFFLGLKKYLKIDIELNFPLFLWLLAFVNTIELTIALRIDKQCHVIIILYYLCTLLIIWIRMDSHDCNNLYFFWAGLVVKENFGVFGEKLLLFFSIKIADVTNITPSYTGYSTKQPWQWYYCRFSVNFIAVCFTRFTHVFKNSKKPRF